MAKDVGAYESIKQLVDMALRESDLDGDHALSKFEFEQVHFPGGLQTLLSHFMPRRFWERSLIFMSCSGLKFSCLLRRFTDR